VAVTLSLQTTQIPHRWVVPELANDRNPLLRLLRGGTRCRLRSAQLEGFSKSLHNSSGNFKNNKFKFLIF
jgi:hypothetical protein